MCFFFSPIEHLLVKPPLLQWSLTLTPAILATTSRWQTSDSPEPQGLPVRWDIIKKAINNTETESPPIKLTQTVAKRQNRPQLKAQVVSFADIKCNLTEIDLTEEQHGDVGESRETLKIQKTWIWGTWKASQDLMKTFKIDDSLIFLRETEKPRRPMRVPI